MPITSHFLFDTLIFAVKALNEYNPDPVPIFAQAQAALEQYCAYKSCRSGEYDPRIDEYMESLFYVVLARISHTLNVLRSSEFDGLDDKVRFEIEGSVIEASAPGTLKHRDNHRDEVIQILKNWINSNLSDRPSKSDTEFLSLSTGLTAAQIRTWFANYRKRKSKN